MTRLIMSHFKRKPVYCVSDQIRHKLQSTVAKLFQKLEKKRQTRQHKKVLISLHRCTADLPPVFLTYAKGRITHDDVGLVARLVVCVLRKQR